jgi:hypothetical protein
VIGTSSSSFGVVGQSGSGASTRIDPAGVVGTSARAIGVAAVSDSNIGLYAHSGPPTIVRGKVSGAILATSTNGVAVSATSSASDGVQGSSYVSNGVGGYSSASYGVYGLSYGPVKPGSTTADLPSGVYGTSKSGGFGVLGVSTLGGVAGVATGVGIGVYGECAAGTAGYFKGNLIVTGTKSAVVPFPDGSRRLLFCVESPDPWFEDFGTGRLKNGRVSVRLGDFAKVIRVGYLVFLTPEGDCRGLCVTGKTASGFEVRELNGGTSSVRFSYRVVGRRRDVQPKRFAKFDQATFLPASKAAPRFRPPVELRPASSQALVPSGTKSASDVNTIAAKDIAQRVADIAKMRRPRRGAGKGGWQRVPLPSPKAARKRG